MTAEPVSAAAFAADARGGNACDPSIFDGIRTPGALGRFVHRREPVRLDVRAAPGAERTALYSIGVFDLAAGPVTVTLPHPGRRHMTLTAMDERHALQAVYHGPGSHTINRDRVGTERVMAVFCLMLDQERPGETAAALALQDAIRVRQGSIQTRRAWRPFQPTAAA